MQFFLSQVLTEGRLLLEFTFDDFMRIRNWHFYVHHHQELVSRSVLMTDPGVMDELSKNITRKGMTNSTLSYLQVSENAAISLTLQTCIISYIK